MSGSRIPCVGAIITGPGGRLLLIKRGKEPEAGRWSLPGGRIEPGETDHEALVREVREETGLTVRPGALIGTVERTWPGGEILDIRDYAAEVTGGDLVPGDDAVGARWVTPADLAELPLTRGLAETLAGWGVLGAPVAGPGAAGPGAAPPALIAEATRRSGIIWLTIPGQERPRPAWHVWRGGAGGEASGAVGPPGAAYVLTGPGEQPLPGLDRAPRVTVAVASKQSGGLIVSWTAEVARVVPGSPEWEAVAGQLAAGRLNAPHAAGEAPAERWAASCAVFRLRPVLGGSGPSPQDSRG